MWINCLHTIQKYGIFSKNKSPRQDPGRQMDINIRKKIPSDIFDYQALSEALKGYAYPRDKISDLLKKKVIIRMYVVK